MITESVKLLWAHRWSILGLVCNFLGFRKTLIRQKNYKNNKNTNPDTSTEEHVKIERMKQMTEQIWRIIRKDKFPAKVTESSGKLTLISENNKFSKQRSSADKQSQYSQVS